jgi:hypothetical protein
MLSASTRSALSLALQMRTMSCALSALKARAAKVREFSIPVEPWAEWREVKHPLISKVLPRGEPRHRLEAYATLRRRVVAVGARNSPQKAFRQIARHSGEHCSIGFTGLNLNGDKNHPKPPLS